ncbi:MAG TPA: AsmA family protein [Acidobacteriaceae bacterium]|nr:AsmA family protein [Acidobacteriaceae bacterium]
MDAEEELGEELSPEERARRRRRLLVALLLMVTLLLAIFVPPLVSLGRYRRSITASIEGALGRPVSVGGISLRLLPLPGIALSDFTVEEDPAFGAEPALHADTVVVSLRLSSLWRRRLEISRISLDAASLNLVRNSAGQWSIDSILLRASQIPHAPTAQRHAGPTPRFPYIEAADSRINFKDGAEKKPFSLKNAEFAMWQAGGGQWRLRLKAQPARTDLPLELSGVGELNVSGSLRRGVSLKTLPVNLTVAWGGAQLGQVSELLTGRDSGWRGSMDLTGHIGGTPADLQLHSTVHIANLRRQEFQPLSSMDVSATCSADYLHQQRALSKLTCFLPVPPGHLLLIGSAHGFAQGGKHLQLEINHVPAEFPVTLLGLMRSSLQNATATGDINGEFRLVMGQQRVLSGSATATGVSITNAGGTFPLPTLRFVAANSTPNHAPEHSVLSAQRRAAEIPQPHEILLEPVAIPFGEAAPLIAEGSLTPSEFTLHLAGAASLQRLTAPGATLGLLNHMLAAAGQKGRADLNVTTTGAWLAPLGGAGPGTGPGLSTSGTVRVAGLQLRPSFLPAPVEVDSADIVISAQQIAWHSAALRYKGIALRGSLDYSRPCDQPTPCPAAFTLQAPALSGSVLSSVLRGRRRGFFGQIFAEALGGARPSPWPPLEGTIQAKVFNLDRLALHQVTAAVSVDRTDLTLKSVDAAALGGTLHATGAMTLVNGAPLWNLDVRCTGLRPSAAAAIFRESWGTGQFDGETKLTLSGWSTAELAASAAGDFQFTWQNGGLTALPGAGPLGHFLLWTGSGTVVNRTLTLTSGGLSRPGGVRAGRVSSVRGSIGFGRHVDLTVKTPNGPARIRGTLTHPAAAAH